LRRRGSSKESKRPLSPSRSNIWTLPDALRPARAWIGSSRRVAMASASSSRRTTADLRRAVPRPSRDDDDRDVADLDLTRSRDRPPGRRWCRRTRRWRLADEWQRGREAPCWKTRSRLPGCRRAAPRTRCGTPRRKRRTLPRDPATALWLLRGTGGVATSSSCRSAARRDLAATPPRLRARDGRRGSPRQAARA
jgi:hypothetical protein